jgi:hypothetical protein
MSSLQSQNSQRTIQKYLNAAERTETQGRTAEWAGRCGLTEAQLREVTALARVVADPRHPQYAQARARLSELQAALMPIISRTPTNRQRCRR